MKEVFLRTIRIENFKGIRSFSLDIDSMLTEVHGTNGAGKTSLYDAYLWLLTGKDSKGSESFKVQPVDENNETIPKLTTKVSCTFSIDGIGVTLAREMYQKWSKPKGTDKEILKGNSTDYFVDGVPHTATSYNNKVKELFCDHDKIRMVSSVFQFFSLPTKEARAILVQIAGEMHDILTEDEFPRLYAEIRNTKTVEGAKQKALFAKKKDEESRTGIPLRIDENERKRPTHDFASLKNEADTIERRIAEIDGVLQRHADATLFDACAELRKRLANVQTMIEDCERSFRKERADAESKCRMVMDDAQRRLNNVIADINSAERTKERIETELMDYERSLDKCRNEWSETNSMEFRDEVDSVCPTCGRPFAEGEIAEMRNERIRRFNVEKVERLKEIGEKGSRFSSAKAKADEELAKIKYLISELEAKRKHIVNVEITEAEKRLNSIPTISNLKDSSNEYQKLISQESSLKEQITFESDKGKKDDGDIELENEKLCLKARYKDVMKMLAEESRIAEIDQRRKELEQEAIEVAERIAEHDALLYEIQIYGKRRINAVEEKVSSMFQIVKFQMYERNLTNDGEKEICEPLVDGVPYTGNLNYAKKVNAGIDVVNALSKWLGVSMPLFIDNKESVFETICSHGQVITLIADKSCEKLTVM